MQSKNKKKFLCTPGKVTQTFSHLALKAGPGVELGGVLYFGTG